MIFFDGSAGSIEGIKAVFDNFKVLSGLSLSMVKTTLYHSGLSSEEELAAVNQGFTVGQLPVRYLGLPLLTRRMRRQDYSPLLDALTKRFSSWTVRNISFSGRLQLLSSVIYSVTNFWMSAFLLPKGCIRDITKLCTRFLWSGDITRKGNAKVSWKALCLPKDEGGLGLRDLTIWNRVLNLKLIWLLFTKGDSLWVVWARRHLLRKHVFWTAPVSSSTSWVWRSLLSLRPFVRQLLHCQLGNGEHASYWFDRWHERGPLIELVGPEGPNRMGVQLHARVKAACIGGTWKLPPERIRCPRLAELRSLLLGVQPPRSSLGNDKFMWGVGSDTSRFFSSRKTWEFVRPHGDKKEWFPVIWFKTGTPKYSFLMWVITLDRLPLRSRLVRWGVPVSDYCCLCSGQSEDRDHLFLTCDISRQIWVWIQSKLHCICDFSTWSQFLHWLRLAPSREQKILRNLAGRIAIYGIWKERNTRLHMAVSRSVPSLIQDIDHTVRATLLALLGRKHHGKLLTLWFRYA